jgi:hypothetical protein
MGFPLAGKVQFCPLSFYCGSGDHKYLTLWRNVHTYMQQAHFIVLDNYSVFVSVFSSRAEENRVYIFSSNVPPSGVTLVPGFNFSDGSNFVRSSLRKGENLPSREMRLRN